MTRAFTVYQDRFPFDGPLELTTITAASHAEAERAAKGRYPGKRLLVRQSGRARSASSSAYRAFLATLVAGGKALADVATPDVWSCHQWGSDGTALGCPMAVAFGVTQLSDVPALHRWQAGRFVQLFDAGLIPMPGAPHE